MRAIAALLVALTACVAVIVLVSGRAYHADRRAVHGERILDAIRAALPPVGENVVANAAIGESLDLSDSVRWALHGAPAGPARHDHPADEAPDGTPDLSRFIARGLVDPGRALRSDLVAHPELIPFKQPGGAPMRFVPASVRILSARWAYARITDGTAGGTCLLAYAVSRGGQITWWRLDARLDQDPPRVAGARAAAALPRPAAVSR